MWVKLTVSTGAPEAVQANAGIEIAASTCIASEPSVARSMRIRAPIAAVISLSSPACNAHRPVSVTSCSIELTYLCAPAVPACSAGSREKFDPRAIATQLFDSVAKNRRLLAVRSSWVKDNLRLREIEDRKRASGRLCRGGKHELSGRLCKCRRHTLTGDYFAAAVDLYPYICHASICKAPRFDQLQREVEPGARRPHEDGSALI
jgi:hypothetical protein